MEWQDEGIVLAVERFGEADAVLEVMTPKFGRHRGYVKGGTGKRQRAIFQPGNQLALTWRSRIEENLGRFTAELVHSPLGSMINDGKRMVALSALAAILSSCLPERETHPNIFSALKVVLDMLENEDAALPIIGQALVKLELGLLSELGYGLDLSECAATGTVDDLKYVSPKSGRAVCEGAGRPYHDRLLPLPDYLLPKPIEPHKILNVQNVLSGLRLTGYFLGQNIWIVRGKGQPPARERFIAALNRLDITDG